MAPGCVMEHMVETAVNPVLEAQELNWNVGRLVVD